ncbi:SDR family oxidoreductase [Nitratireductor kimnyeongensis]|uniref:SDR family oxidoreductase n=1 Tax=Nitratireductor kimnyeongensis TaxID=430679 RepID=A0ABW0TB65_9HYPH|nr:SDR family oxidoreductase [Nitratireductor kimnyeongensis]QZZ36880.1 SDR family oxidoreductase [Nitratireductor kimnyeongensis]
MKTLMITGCSSGFGQETARHFISQGWSVVATMRKPEQGALPASVRLRILPLDVTDPVSIRRAVEDAGPIDALVNNAGIGWMGPLEGIPEDMIREIFDTNTFGTMEMTRAVLPQFRQRKAGVIVNVSSSTTLKALPLLPVYTASKAAVNAFTECLALEVEPFGIRARLVLPGRAPATRFGANARILMSASGSTPDAYEMITKRVFDGMKAAADEPVTEPADVVAAIWRAVTEPNCPLRQAAGADALALAA